MEKTEKPNWDKWQNMLEVVLWEAVALSLDVEPDYLDSRDEIYSRHRQPKLYKDEKDFNDRYDVAESHMGIGKPLRPGSILPRAHRAGISLAEFSAWAQSINWEIPQELADLAKERSQSSTQSNDENKVEQKKSINGQSIQHEDIVEQHGEVVESNREFPNRQIKKETYVFRKHGNGWSIGPESSPVFVKKRKGLLYLRVLLMSPGKEIDALEIANIVNEPTMPNESYDAMTDDELGNEGLSSRNGKGTRSLNADDKKTLEVYKKGLQEVDEAIVEAEGNNDIGKKEELENTRNLIFSEIRKLADSDGNLKKYLRVQETSHEKARNNVPKNIRRTLAVIRESEGGADLKDFIEKRLHYNNPLSYTPKLGDPTWDFN